MFMKKIGALSAGIVIVIAILALQRESISVNIKRIFHEVTHDIENGIITVYHEIKSFVTAIDGI